MAPFGDHGLVRVSMRAALAAGPALLILEGVPFIDEGELHIDPAVDGSDDRALLFLQMTAMPARKRVSYDLPAVQILARRPIERPFGRRTHRWHEVVGWVRPQQHVVVSIDSLFPQIKIDPLRIDYDGYATPIVHQPATEPIPSGGNHV